jgi:hypothetical protein
MNFNNKRIWKTGALAVSVTLVFAIFAFNFEDWTKGLSSEFVYAQTTEAGGTGTSGGSGTGGTGGTGVTKIIPQIVVGTFDPSCDQENGITKYDTVIQIVNTGSTPTTVTGNFYNQNGSASTLQMKASTSPMSFTGTLPSTSLAGNAVMLIVPEKPKKEDSPDTDCTTPSGMVKKKLAGAAVNWGKITTTGPASVSSYFEFRDNGTSFLYTRVGLAGSSATLKKFIIPWIRNAQTGLDVGFALVNSGSTAANITVTAKDASGATLGTPRVHSAAAGSHVANFANQFLSLTPGPAGTNAGYLLFEGSAATFAAAALAFEAGALSSFPIEVLE